MTKQNKLAQGRSYLAIPGPSVMPDAVLSDKRRSDATTSAAYLAVVVVLVVLCVAVHAWVQKCKPARLCAARA